MSSATCHVCHRRLISVALLTRALDLTYPRSTGLYDAKALIERAIKVLAGDAVGE